MMRRLRKMIAHELSDASSNIAITICTGMLACTISLRIESGSPIVHCLRGHGLAQELWQPPRPQARGIDAGDAHLRFDQKPGTLRPARRGAVDALREAQRRRPFHARLAGDLELRMALCAQPLGARALEKAQVIGVIDDRAAVGILPVHARGPGEQAHRSASKSGSVAARSGGLMPKCR